MPLGALMKRLIVVDISSFIFRAFYAIRPMSTPKGEPVNAVYGVLSMLLKLIASNNPTHLVLARDLSGGSFRNEKYEQYKANRSAPPDDLIPQFKMIETLIEKMKIPNTAIQNYEADDIIGSYCVQFKEQFDEILIASSDKDLMQFIGGPVMMLDTMKGKLFKREDVFEKMGVYPEQIVDYLSLLGDTSDNIPGVKGIGAKGASKLLAEYQTLDGVIENLDKLTNKRAKTALENYKDDAFLSKGLVEIVTDLELGLKEEELEYTLEPNDELLEYLDVLNFKSIKAKIAQSGGGSVAQMQSSRVDYKVLSSEDAIGELVEDLEDEDIVFIEALFEGADYHKTSPSIYTVSTPEKNYVLYGKDYAFKEMVCKLSEIEDLKIATTNSKALHICLLEAGQKKDLDVFDITQAHFVVDPEKKHDLNTISIEVLTEDVPLIKELLKENLEEITSQKNLEFGLAKRANAAMKIYPWLYKKLMDMGSLSIFADIDMPLMPILAKMEWLGVGLDVDFYKELEGEFSKITEGIDEEVLTLSGEKVNLKSPKQVRELLFDKLELPIIKKTKTGPSTDSSVLEELDKMGESEIPGLILKYREIEKLNSTYVKALPTLVQKDGKLHTHFNQHVAATGRLSSDKPNLQNIPVKTDNGRRLRKGFKAEAGHVLLGADYSQVELRLLAHCSEDKVMIDAFNNDEDIHAQTASEIFEIALSDVSKEQRGYAKAINFGLMYGQSSFGLSQMLGISRGEAKDYITRYFERFSSVKSYLDSLKESCEKTGFAETIFNRKRLVKDINSTNRMVKSGAERVAINSPIQGTAADIIKMAMIKIDQELKDKDLKSVMILQVHDELIFSVPENEVDQMKDIVKTNMETITKLRIPLKVDMGVATNWYELK